MRLDVFDSFFHYHCFDYVTKESVQDFIIFHEKTSSKTEIAYHQHELIELYYTVSGNVTYYINGRDFVLAPGDIFVIGPGELHMQIYEGNASSEIVIILVNVQFFKEFSLKNKNIRSFWESITENKYIHIHPGEDFSENIKSTLGRLEKAYNGVRVNLKYDYFLELIYLVSNISDLAENASGLLRQNTKINSIIEYIDNNLNNDLSLNFLSNNFYISKYHLLREFSKYTNSTLHQYILQKRLSLSKKLIDNGQTLDMVYRKCGFESYSTFSNAFKKKYGITPKKYSSKDT